MSSEMFIEWGSDDVVNEDYDSYHSYDEKYFYDSCDIFDAEEYDSDEEYNQAVSSMVGAPGQPHYEAMKTAVVDALGEDKEVPIDVLLERVRSASQHEMIAVLELMSKENVIKLSEYTVIQM